MVIIPTIPETITCVRCGSDLLAWDARHHIRTEGGTVFVDEAAAVCVACRTPDDDPPPVATYESSSLYVRDDLGLPPVGTLIMLRQIGLLIPRWKQPHMIVWYCVKVGTWSPALPQPTETYATGEAVLVCLGATIQGVVRLQEWAGLWWSWRDPQRPVRTEFLGRHMEGVRTGDERVMRYAEALATGKTIDLGGNTEIDVQDDIENVVGAIAFKLGQLAYRPPLLPAESRALKKAVGFHLYPGATTPPNSLGYLLRRIRERSGLEWDDLVRLTRAPGGR